MFGFDPDPSSVIRHYLFAYGQADARAGIFLLGMQALKDLKYPFVVLRFYPQTIILYGKDPFIPDFPCADMNLGR